jgi:hypothetical protein
VNLVAPAQVGSDAKGANGAPWSGANVQTTTAANPTQR